MKPGDIVENGWASKDNPIRISLVIKDKGRTVVCTDGKGDIWDSPKGPKLKVIGHVTLSPIGQEGPDYKAMCRDAEHWRKVKKIFTDGAGIPVLLGTMRDIVVTECVEADRKAEHTPQAKPFGLRPQDKPEETPEGKDEKTL